MQSLSSELKAVISRRIEAARPCEILQIASVLSFEEAEPAPLVPKVAPHFERVDTWGVRDNVTGLVWTREPVAGGKRNWKDSMEAACKVDFGGHQWRAPTIAEQLTLVNYERHSPAIDPIFVCPSDWFWTSTPDVESPGVYAWYVYFSYGLSFRLAQGGVGFVRAVRVGQF
jgi:hypothetical protein